jgi:hypothetical protein
MDISSVLPVMAGLSPYVATLACVVILVYLVIQYRLKRQEAAKESAEAEKYDYLTKLMADHDNGAKVRHEVATEFYAKMLRELQTISAAQTGTLNSGESKIIIRNQFMYAREELLKVARASIARNHFRGRESHVAGKVYRAWFQSAKKSFESIAQFKSVKYPFAPLYSHILPQIWHVAWDILIPTYYFNSSDLKPSPSDVDAKFEDCSNSICMMWDSVLNLYIEACEDPEHGLVYSGVTLNTALIEDPAVAEAMATRMKDYAHYRNNGGNTDKWSQTPSLDSLRVVINNTLADLIGKESKVYTRIKSDANIPAMK